jgi:hypothetical protein
MSPAQCQSTERFLAWLLGMHWLAMIWDVLTSDVRMVIRVGELVLSFLVQVATLEVCLNDIGECQMHLYGEESQSCGITRLFTTCRGRAAFNVERRETSFITCSLVSWLLSLSISNGQLPDSLCHFVLSKFVTQADLQEVAKLHICGGGYIAKSAKLSKDL